MKKISVLCMLLVSLGCWGQNAKELFPTLGKSIELSKQGEKAFIERQLDGEEFPDSKSNYWEVIGIRCSFYCASSLGEQVATSELKPQHGLSYFGRNIHDLNLQTAWVEGVPGYGVGEAVTYTLPPENPRITKVIVLNGYLKSDKAWRENSRVKTLNMYVGDSLYAVLQLKDSKQEQIFEVGRIGHDERADKEALKKMSPVIIRFEIADYYPGEKYDDTAITEIYFDGIDHH